MSEGTFYPRRTDGDALLEEAIGALDTADLLRLEKAAKTWIELFELEGDSRGPDDLLGEAVARTLDGRRRWRPEVPLVHHLYLTMRSIASSWRKGALQRRKAGARAVRSADLAPPGRSRDFPDALDGMPADDPAADRRLVAAERLQALLDRFAGDPRTSAVLEGWYDGMKGPEIRDAHGLSKQEFEAAVRMIRRFARRGDSDHAH